MSKTRRNIRVKRGGNLPYHPLPPAEDIPRPAYLIVGASPFREANSNLLLSANTSLYFFDIDYNPERQDTPRYINIDFNNKELMDIFIALYEDKFDQVIIDNNVLKFYEGDKYDILQIFLKVVKHGGKLIYNYQQDYSNPIPPNFLQYKHNRKLFAEKMKEYGYQKYQENSAKAGINLAHAKTSSTFKKYTTHVIETDTNTKNLKETLGEVAYRVFTKWQKRVGKKMVLFVITKGVSGGNTSRTRKRRLR